MPSQPLEVTQGIFVKRCSVTLGAAANLYTAVIAAFEAQQAGRGTAIASATILGSKILTSSAGFTCGDTSALSTMITIASGTSYSEPASMFLQNTWVAGSGTMIVAVYLQDGITIP